MIEAVLLNLVGGINILPLKIFCGPVDNQDNVLKDCTVGNGVSLIHFFRKAVYPSPHSTPISYKFRNNTVKDKGPSYPICKLISLLLTLFQIKALDISVKI